MKIGIDASALEGEETGVRRYLTNLLKNLEQVAPQHQYILYSRRRLPQLKFLTSRCWQKRIVKGAFGSPNKYSWYFYALGLAVRKDKLDVLFLPSYRIPFLVPASVKKIVTIHDVSFKAFPQWSNLAMRIGSKLFSEWGLRSVWRVITVSNFSKQEIMKYYQVPTEKIKVTYEGIDPIFAKKLNTSNQQQLQNKFNPQKKTILYVGSIFNRRHVPNLLRAFADLSGKMNDLQIIIVGKNKTTPQIDIGELVKKYSSRGNIIWEKYVSDDVLQYLYRLADVFVYPSTYEGFGLPPLEAMTQGVPVVVGKGSSLSEVVAEAGVVVDPRSVSDLTKKIHRLLSDASWRELMAKKGMARAQEFSWEKCAEETAKIFSEA